MKAFGNNKRNVSSSERIAELNSMTQYKFAKELASSRCNYVRNNTVNKNFTVDYGYTSDSLVGSVRNVDSYKTLLQLSKGHNICECNKELNTAGGLTELQKYSYQDLSGISLYDACGNKLFDDIFFNMCNDIDYTLYETAMTGENRISMTNNTTYLSGFNYPKKIELMSDYAKPEIVLYTAIPTTNYLIKLQNIIIKTIIDSCFDTNNIIKDIQVELYKQIVAQTIITSSEITKIYEIQEQDAITGIITGNLQSFHNSTEPYINHFTNININKPGVNYFLKFTNNDSPDISSNFFNVYGQFKRFKAPGLYNTEIENTNFTEQYQTINQGATTGTVKFSPTINGDYYYQSKYNDNVFGEINILDAPSGHIDVSKNYIITLQNGYPYSSYYITVSGETTSANSPTLQAYTGDTLIFDICENQVFTNHPLFIQEAPGAPINTTVIEDSSGVIGIAGEIVSTISAEIMDNYSNKFNSADNTIIIKLDSANNPNNAILTGTTEKNATSGNIVFDDLVINRPGEGYKFLIYTEDGEIIQSLSPEFSILGNLLFISKNDVRQYIVGEDISNLGVRMENAEFDNSTDIHIILGGGELQTTTTYNTQLDVAINGNNIITLSGGEAYTDFSINKIGFDYSIEFDASNAASPINSELISIVGLLDVSNNIEPPSNTKLNLKSGSSLDNFLIKLKDICDNVISLNADVSVNIFSLNTTNNTSTLRETHNANMIDGSLNLGNITINTTGFDYFIEVSMNEAATSQNTELIDVNADIDISAQPFKYADRIFGTDLNAITGKVVNLQDEIIEQDLSLFVDFLQSPQGVIIEGDSTIDTSGGYAVFEDIDLFISTPLLESKQNLNLLIGGQNQSDNLNTFTSDSFTILYTNWNSNSKNRVAPGITSIPTEDHLIYADATYRPFDSSYIIVKADDPSNNSPHWKINTTDLDGIYIRTLVWDISYQETAGAIMRIQRKLYTEDVSNELYNADADFSFIPLYEVEQSASEGREPYTYYYDYSFNSTYMSYSQHYDNTNAIQYNNTIYDTSWSLATFRSQMETDIVAAKLKLDASNNVDISENCDYYIGGKMDMCLNKDPDYYHILYHWDVSGEYNHYIWVGPKSKID